MQKIIIYRIFTMIVILFAGLAQADDLKALFDQVEQLKLERNGYILGAALNNGQMKTAKDNPVESSSKDTFKFKDKNLYVVAQKTSNRVLVMYEQFEAAPQKEIQSLIGDLYMSFDDPTVLAHDKVVYWAYTKKGKISSKEFDSARRDKKKLTILATVKCISDINITEKVKESEPAIGQVYYIISSDPILKLFQDQLQSNRM
ncbi:MAG: hypothetical protein H8D87_02925 [Deltaproteobacteria bacterium]|uniref:hypothetical protein n=1 Tax=Desulfobacula sp. TaxID=2593537 RepID=UPI0019BC40B1|nr:hypothetical protein [Candidatus Desulfobacula maris]MBL6995731.1 hypothetical protein [Desulfobacula sp.]